MDGTAAEVDTALSHLERRIAAQSAALARVPAGGPVPRSVIALLATAPRELDGLEVPPRHRPRLVKLLTQVQAMVDQLTERQRQLAGRLTTVRVTRRGGTAPHTLDFTS